MTNRQRFESVAIAHGATVLYGDDTTLTVLATDGIMKTTYQFDENGKFVAISH